MGGLQPGARREGIGWDCITANMLLFSRQALFLRLINVYSAPCHPEAYECSIQRRPVLASPVSLQAAWQSGQPN